jgi:uncharacterized protein YraI
MYLSHLTSAIALGAAIVTLGIGGAFAATTLDTSVSVLAGPGDSYHAIAKLKAGDTVKVTHEASNWCKISAPDAGWVPCSDITGMTSAKLAAPAMPAASTDVPIYNPHNDNAVADRNNPNNL